MFGRISMKRICCEIEDLLESGASVEISGKDYTLSFLEDFAELAAQSGGVLSITDTDDLPSFYLHEILSKGGRNVVFK